MKKSGDENDLYLQSDTLLWANIFELFCNAFLKMDNLDHFYLLQGLTWIATPKKTEIKLDSNMFFMIELGNRKCDIPFYS